VILPRDVAAQVEIESLKALYRLYIQALKPSAVNLWSNWGQLASP
jgi:hypothetical protein